MPIKQYKRNGIKSWTEKHENVLLERQSHCGPLHVSHPPLDYDQFMTKTPYTKKTLKSLHVIYKKQSQSTLKEDKNNILIKWVLSLCNVYYSGNVLSLFVINSNEHLFESSVWIWAAFQFTVVFLHYVKLT